jgi:hypothetical protein
MATALDAPEGTLDEAETAFVSMIREHGWFRTSVFDDGSGPAFSYTTGFWHTLKAPEIIVFSLPNEVAHEVLWDLYRDFASGVVFHMGRRLSNVFADTEAVFLPVAEASYPAHVGWSRWFYGDDGWPCWQLVWPDGAGRFPWEPGFEDGPYRQPNLTGRPWPSI